MPSQLPDYGWCSIINDGTIKYGVTWRKRFDPIAVCDDQRDARRIAEALNSTGGPSVRPLTQIATTGEACLAPNKEKS